MSDLGERWGYFHVCGCGLSVTDNPLVKDCAMDPLPLDRLRHLIHLFEECQRHYASCGAQDTEPDGIFQELLARCARGKALRVPTSAEGWELYSDEPKAKWAAEDLTARANAVLDFIYQLPIGQAGPCLDYLKSYCWRVDWAS